MVSSRSDNGRDAPLKFSVAVWLCLVGMAFALALLVPPHAATPARVMAGAVTRLLAGDTAGRQALVGSAWWGIMPTLLSTPAALLSDGGRSLLPFTWIHIFSLCVTWMMLFNFLRKRLPIGVAVVMAATPLCSPQLWLFAAGGSGRGWALMFAIYTALSVAEWAETALLRCIVRAAFGAALLLLCGIDLMPWLLMPLFILFVNPLCWRALRRRWSALVMLGALPALYGAGVWVLVNWLVMEDPLFFVRSIPRLLIGQEIALADPDTSALLVVGVAVVGIGAGLVRRSGRTVALCVMAITGVLLGLLYRGTGVDWMAGLPLLLADLLALLIIGDLLASLQSRSRMVVAAFASVAIALGLLQARHETGEVNDALYTGAKRDVDVSEIAEYVRDTTPHGRVFVLGYAALGLLIDVEDDLFVPVLDLYVPVLRVDYYNQELFLLVKRPEGRDRMDGVLYRHEDLYAFGTERAIFLKDWGDWRLFRIVTAPRRDPSSPPDVTASSKLVFISPVPVLLPTLPSQFTVFPFTITRACRSTGRHTGPW